MPPCGNRVWDWSDCGKLAYLYRPQGGSTLKFHRHRFVHAITLATLAVLLFTLAALPAQAQAPAAPTNLTAELTDTEGEVRLTWGAAEGAASYRACWRVQSPAGAWSCVNRTTTNALIAGLAVDTTYDFAVASFDGGAYSAWVWTNLMVEAVTPHFCPITGLAIPEGYLSVNESTTDIFGRTFRLTGITRMSAIAQYGTVYLPPGGRQFLKVCGTVEAPSDAWTTFHTGTSNNLSTDLGIGFTYFDDHVTNWYDVDVIPAGETRRACDIWDVPANAATAIYAVNNFQADAGVFLVNLP